MKKVISCILIFALVFCMTTGAFAVEKDLAPTLKATYDTGDGTYFTFLKKYQSEEWTAIIYVPNNSDVITFDARSSKGETVYSSCINRDEVTLTFCTPETFAFKCVEVGFDTLDKAKVIDVSTCLVENESIIMPRDSAIADIEEQLISLYGNEYNDEIVRSYTHYTGVSTIEVREGLAYRISRNGNIFIPAGITLSAAALLIGGHWGTALGILGNALGVTGNLIEEIKTVDTYEVTAIWSRYGTVNGGSYGYCMANKFINYEGVDELNNSRPAYINKLDTYYVPSQTYYNSHITIANDTYDTYIGA